MVRTRILPTVLALALAPAIGLGIARFAYALLLPDMRADLDWTYATAGWINTTNALGYLVGALLAAPAVGSYGAIRTMHVGVWLCVVAVAGCALFDGVIALNALRVVAGFGAGYAFVAGGVIISQIAEDHADHGTFYLALYYAGPGLGIVISGLAVPSVLFEFGTGSWRMAWGILGATSAVLAIGLLAANYQSSATSKVSGIKPSLSLMRFLLIAYFSFGAGYIGYMTFIIAWVQAHGIATLSQSIFWIVIGLGVMSSPWLWSNLLRTQRHGRAVSILTCLVAIGSLLPLLSNSMPVLLLSAGLFGCSFFAVVAATTAFVRRNFPRDAWPAAIGGLTFVFGIGQMLGPLITGAVNDMHLGIAGGQWISTGLLAVATLVALLQRDTLPFDQSKI